MRQKTQRRDDQAAELTVAYITDELSIRRILDHLGLSPPVEAKPPPPREVVRCR